MQFSRFCLWNSFSVTARQRKSSKSAEKVKTTRKTGGLHKPYKGLRQAAPKGAVKRSADRI